jgi:eukaryotic-like serine/threonine-protein kinase
MTPSHDQSVFPDTTMNSELGEAEVGSYGFLGRYRLDRMIGHGAMGAVFEAFDSTLGRTIAIKTLYTQPDQVNNGFDTATVDAAILQEARAAATLNHPHIVTVYDAGRAPSTMLHRDLPYVAMELLQGTDLRHRMNALPALGQREAVALIGKLALALDHAHKGGVLHRDIKPANIFITHGGAPKILDFGLAKFTARAAQASNAASSEIVAGSPQYMSPEMVRSITHSQQVVDARSDVYSLGVILYELLCGKKPFTAPTLELLQALIAQEPPVLPHVANPAIPLDLSQIMLQALAKNPQDRYRSAGQLARELRRWGSGPEGGEPAQSATQPGASAVGTLGAGLTPALGADSLPAQQVPAVSAFSQAPARPLWLWWLAGTVLIGGIALWQMRSSAPPLTTVPTTNQNAAPLPAAVAPTLAAPATTSPSPTAANANHAAPVSAISLPTSAVAASAAQASAEPNSTGTATPALATTGKLRVAVTPWGSIEIDGKAMGVSPPLTLLSLSPGEHTVVLRNSDFAARTFKIKVQAGKTERVAHRFE